MVVGSIEMGGTNCNCAVGLADGTILEKIRIATKEPDVTIKHAVAFFQEHKITALGIGSFGPINVDQTSSEYGQISLSPKKEWAHFPLRQRLFEQLKVPIIVHTDVMASCLGEVSVLDSAAETVLYLTVGTGVGGSVVVNGHAQSSTHHAEMGHISVERVALDTLESVCAFHSNCLEGLASGTAIRRRWGQAGDSLEADHPAWEMEAEYIAQGLCQYIFTVAPTRIILGGGVMQQKQLVPLIRQKVQEKIGSYYFYDALYDLEKLIQLPSLGSNSALVGGLLMHKTSE